MRRARLGLLVNPMAGIGGRVGLKGSDGVEIQELAIKAGAVPLAQDRAVAALKAMGRAAESIELLAGEGKLGEAAAHQAGLNPHATARPPGAAGRTTAADTRHIARVMQREQVELILFAGGDGTARDIYHAVGNEFPVLGIPAGVKIFSAAFGISPKRAGELAGAYLRDKHVPLREVEVLDLDEAAYRQGIISPQLYGTLLVPFERRRLQSQKAPTPFSESAQAQAIAARVIAEMAPGQAYLLGPGTTTRAVADRLGIANTLVGADIVTRDEALALDVGEGQILDMLSRQPLGMIVTPTGGQGFLFGRGNQQFSPEVLKLVGRENIVVISLPGKIAALRGRPLLIDTGDEDTDRYLEGYFDIISGYHERIVYRVAAAG